MLLRSAVPPLLLKSSVALALLLPSLLSAQEPAHMMHALLLADRARTAGDRTEVLRMLQAAARFTPAEPAVLIELARAHAALGNGDSAIAALERLSLTGRAADLRTDTALAALRNDPRFDRAAAAAARAGAPLTRSDTLFTIPTQHLVPEGIAYDPGARTHYLGSIAGRKVLRIDAAGRVGDFIPDAGGEVLGLRVDAARGFLWAATFTRDSTAPPGVTGGAGRAALARYDLATGRLLARLRPPDVSVPHLLNDLALAADGTVFVTDSEAGVLYRARPGVDTLEVHMPRVRGVVYPNGIAGSVDGRALYVAHLEGIRRVDAVSGEAAELGPPAGRTIGFIDGLQACGDALVGIQRAGDFHRVIRMTLDAGGRNVTDVIALEQRHPAHRIPTTGAIVAAHLHYIANSELDRLRPDGTLADGGGEGVVVLRLPLGTTCK